MTTLQEVKSKNISWFSPENKKFFGDIRYLVLHDKDKKPYLVRETNAWTDMFDGMKKTHFRINVLEEDLKIGDLVDNIFKNLEDVREWLRD